MGRILKESFFSIFKAYLKAKRVQYQKELIDYKHQLILLNKSLKYKILIIAHPYNLYDKLIGIPIIKYLEKLNVMPIYADKVNHRKVSKLSKKNYQYFALDL